MCVEQIQRYTAEIGSGLYPNGTHTSYAQKYERKYAGPICEAFLQYSLLTTEPPHHAPNVIFPILHSTQCLMPSIFQATISPERRDGGDH